MKRLGLADLREIVTDAAELAKGTQVFDGNGLAHLARHENRLYAEATGSGAAPYKVSVVMGEGPAEVKARCSCMAARSRPFCKHAAALLVAWARAPEAFVESEAPPAPAGAGGARKKTVRTGKTDAAVVMREGVERVATLVRELGASGVAALGADRVPQLRGLAESLRASQLRRLSARVLDLARLLEEAGRRRTPLAALEYTDLVADMLLTARKLERHAAGEPLDDRHVEELVGKSWRKGDRRPVDGLDLVEYAFSTRVTSDQFVIRESRFVDVASGRHYSEKQILPAALARRTEPKRSYPGRLLAGAAGSIYPGYPPHRLDLERVGGEEPLAAAALERLVERALPGAGAALAALQEHRKDVFAPDLVPVAVRVDTLLARGARLQVVDAEGNALHLPDDPALEEQLAGSLREVALVAMLGDVAVEAALPALRPLAVVVKGPFGLELRVLPGAPEASPGGRRRAAPTNGQGPQLREGQAARAAGASTAAVSLAEVREELADGLVTGLASLTPRATGPLAARLQDLGLDKPAALLEGLARKPEAAERIDDFVKLYQVLGIALVRLAGTTRIDREAVVRVPTYESVVVPRPAGTMEPREVAAARAAGRLDRYQAAVQVARYYEGLPADALAAHVFPAWADGSVGPFVAHALAGRGREALEVARGVLAAKKGRIARMTAVRVLAALDDPAAERALAALAGSERDTALRAFAAVERRRGEVADRVREQAQLLLAAPQKEDRAAAARALGELGSLAAAPALRRACLADVATDVREAAALALGRLGDAEMVDTFVRLLAARQERDAEATSAARALGHMGDARGVFALLDAYAEGWKPGVVAEALRSVGAVAIEPLVQLVEGRPEIADRKAALGVLEQLPVEDVAACLVARLGATREAPAFAVRAALYLRLAAVHAESHRAVARRIADLLPAASGKEEKALLRAAGKALGSAAKV